MTDNADGERAPLKVSGPPPMDARMQLALPIGLRDVIEDMARDAGFTGRFPAPDYIRAVLLARVQHERPEDYKRIQGAA